MVRGRVTESPNYKKYGVPIYGAAWVPPAAVESIADSSEQKQKEDGDSTAVADFKASLFNHVVLAGGGGEGRSGIPNALMISKFDSESNSLSDQPVAQVGTGGDVPYRVAVHPGGEGLICSFPQSCRWYEWDSVQNNDTHAISIKPSEKILNNLEDVGLQLSMVFNADGSLLATGGEDGKLRVLRWPSMDIILDESNAHASVKGLDFSPDGKYLVSAGSGPARVWDVKECTAVTSLQKEKDEIFGFCKFSRVTDVLYITAVKGDNGIISIWNTAKWERVGSKKVRNPISSLSVSFDGKFLAVGTVEGEIIILKSSTNNTLVQEKAHLGVATAIMFSHNSSSLLSASLDSSVRVTQIKDEKSTGFPLRNVLLIITLAILWYYLKSNGRLPKASNFPFRL